MHFYTHSITAYTRAKNEASEDKQLSLPERMVDQALFSEKSAQRRVD